MKLDLGELLKALALPVGLVAVFAAVLSFLGLDLDQVEAIAGGMLGCQFAIALLIDVAKNTGAVDVDQAGKISAVLNILLIVGVAAVLYVNPLFDFSALDARVKVFADFIALLAGLILQLSGTQSFHNVMRKGLGIKRFSASYLTYGES